MVAHCGTIVFFAACSGKLAQALRKQICTKCPHFFRRGEISNSFRHSEAGTRKKTLSPACAPVEALNAYPGVSCRRAAHCIVASSHAAASQFLHPIRSANNNCTYLHRMRIGRQA